MDIYISWMLWNMWIVNRNRHVLCYTCIWVDEI